MALNPDQIPTLQTELAADPMGLGYNEGQPDEMPDGLVADTMNLVREGDPAYVVRRGVVPTYEIQSRLDYVEVAGLQAGARQALEILVSGEQIDISSDNVRQAIATWFPPASDTRAMLATYQNRAGSRAEVVFGVNSVVDHMDVAHARGRGV